MAFRSSITWLVAALGLSHGASQTLVNVKYLSVGDPDTLMSDIMYFEVVSMCDLNGDGQDDIVYMASEQQWAEGFQKLYVRFGKNDWPRPSWVNSTMPLGEPLDGKNGFTIITVGRVQRVLCFPFSSDDDLPDLVFTDVLESTSKENVVVVKGKKAGEEWLPQIDTQEIDGTVGFYIGTPSVSVVGYMFASFLNTVGFTGLPRKSLTFTVDYFDDVPEWMKFGLFVVHPRNTDLDFSSLTKPDGFFVKTIRELEYWGSEVASADVNGDGLEDLLINDFDMGTGIGYVHVIPGSASVDFGPLVTLPDDLVSVNGWQITAPSWVPGSKMRNAGDVNGDGKEDVVVVSLFINETSKDEQYESETFILFGPISSVWPPDASTGIRGPGYAVDMFSFCTPDFDGDGNRDMVVVSGGNISVYFGPHTETSLETPEMVFYGQYIWPSTRCSFGDLDADGKDDVVFRTGGTDFFSSRLLALTLYGRTRSAGAPPNTPEVEITFSITLDDSFIAGLGLFGPTSCTEVAMDVAGDSSFAAGFKDAILTALDLDISALNIVLDWQCDEEDQGEGRRLAGLAVNVKVTLALGIPGSITLEFVKSKLQSEAFKSSVATQLSSGSLATRISAAQVQVVDVGRLTTTTTTTTAAPKKESKWPAWMVSLFGGVGGLLCCACIACPLAAKWRVRRKAAATSARGGSATDDQSQPAQANIDLEAAVAETTVAATAEGAETTSPRVLTTAAVLETLTAAGVETTVKGETAEPVQAHDLQATNVDCPAIVVLEAKSLQPGEVRPDSLAPEADVFGNVKEVAVEERQPELEPERRTGWFGLF